MANILVSKCVHESKAKKKPKIFISKIPEIHDHLTSLQKSVSIATAGWIFATRSFAIFAGGCATGSIFHRLNPALFLFCTAVIQLLSLYYIPLVDNFGLLLFLVFCIGCGIGMVDVGGQSIILKKFKRDSTQLIQLFHFVFNCGAILGNTIVGAYIEPAAETPCKGNCGF